MQRIANFFKPSDDSTPKTSPHEKLEQLKTKRSDLMKKLNNAALEQQIERLEDEVEELTKSNKENEDLVSKLAILSVSAESVFSLTVMSDIISNERKQTVKYRLKECQAHQQLRDTKENPDNEVKPWKICEVCDREFGESEQRVPRIIACGHTICHECVIELNTIGLLVCPFDGKLTDLRNRSMDTLPKNFSVLDM